MLQTLLSELLHVSHVLQVRQQEDGIARQQRWERPRGPHPAPETKVLAGGPALGTALGSGRDSPNRQQSWNRFNRGNNRLETGMIERLVIRLKVWSGATPGVPKWLPGVPSLLFSIRRWPLGEGRLPPPPPPEDRRVKTRLQTPLSSPFQAGSPLTTPRRSASISVSRGPTVRWHITLASTLKLLGPFLCLNSQQRRGEWTSVAEKQGERLTVALPRIHLAFLSGRTQAAHQLLQGDGLVVIHVAVLHKLLHAFLGFGLLPKKSLEGLDFLFADVPAVVFIQQFEIPVDYSLLQRVAGVRFWEPGRHVGGQDPRLGPGLSRKASPPSSEFPQWRDLPVTFSPSWGIRLPGFALRYKNDFLKITQKRDLANIFKLVSNLQMAQWVCTGRSHTGCWQVSRTRPRGPPLASQDVHLHYLYPEAFYSSNCAPGRAVDVTGKLKGKN